MEIEAENARPNIRIQIQNDVSEDSLEKMDIDVLENENEEGEITDDNENDKVLEDAETVPIKKAPKSHVTSTFSTGINTFDKNEQEKLKERARRFALKPEEINSFCDEDLQQLHESLGIDTTNQNEVIFEKVHLLGLNEMTPEDLVDYFAGYAPESIEWIDPNCCNIVWLDNLSSARALHFKSRVVRGMPARQPKDLFPKEFLDNVEEPVDETGQSILIRNKNREIQLQNEIGEIMIPKRKAFPKNSVDILDITVPIPPGYWRLGVTHPKSKCLLMRYALLSDKLAYSAEKCSKYYKKIAQKGVISETKKKELRGIFQRNKDLSQSTKNPWGSLAENWDRDAKFREREPAIYNVDEQVEEPLVEIKNPKLMARLGSKREEADSEKPEGKPEGNDSRKWAKERKKLKAPRMKMYADEEEENLKRKKILQKIIKQAEVIDKASDRDLRDMLGPRNRVSNKKETLDSEENIDLGSKLKNRSQKMIFAIERDLFHADRDILYNTGLPDLYTSELGRQRERYPGRERSRSPLVSRSVLLRQIERERRHSPVRRRSPDRLTRFRREIPERSLHSDKIPSRRHRSISQHNKPRSKVAVVIEKPRKPTVASTIWSKVHQSSDSESESDSEESSSSSKSESESSKSESSDENDSNSSSEKFRREGRNPDRPGFDKSRLAAKLDHKSPLKITMANDRYRSK